MSYVKYNNNPKNRRTSDCVIRSIALAFDKSWETVFEELVVIARTLKTVPTSKEVYDKYLEDFQTINVMYINGGGSKKRYKPLDIVKWKGTYLISIAGHLTVVKNQKLYDTWNCLNKSAYKIWKIKN